MMFEVSAKNGFCDVILGSEEKTLDLAAHFYTILALQMRFVYYSNVQQAFKDGKIKSRQN